MRAILKKRWSSRGGASDERTYGEIAALPKQGENFTLSTNPDEQDRGILTSPVLAVRNLDASNVRFYTENSVYELELLG